MSERENNQKVIEGLMSHCHGMLQLLGEDPQREGLQKTPERVVLLRVHFLCFIVW